MRCNSCKPFVVLLRHFDDVAVPIHHLVGVKFFHVRYVVGVIVNFDVGTVLVETFYQHTLFVEVGKTHGTDYFFHPYFFCPLHQLGKQRLGYFKVVHHVETGETQLLDVVFLVDALVPDAGNSAHNFVVAVRKKHFALAKTEGVVCLRVKLRKLVHVQIG